MKSNNLLMGLSILFFVLAVAFSLAFWADVSWAAKIAFFVLGFGSGATAGEWLAGERIGPPALTASLRKPLAVRWQRVTAGLRSGSGPTPLGHEGQ